MRFGCVSLDASSRCSFDRHHGASHHPPLRLPALPSRVGPHPQSLLPSLPLSLYSPVAIPFPTLFAISPVPPQLEHVFPFHSSGVLGKHCVLFLQTVAPVVVWGRSLVEAEAKCEIRVQFLMFSCTMFLIS